MSVPNGRLKSALLWAWAFLIAVQALDVERRQFPPTTMRTSSVSETKTASAQAVGNTIAANPAGVGGGITSGKALSGKAVGGVVAGIVAALVVIALVLASCRVMKNRNLAEAESNMPMRDMRARGYSEELPRYENCNDEGEVLEEAPPPDYTTPAASTGDLVRRPEETHART
jgi:hypothetical protein